MQQFEINAATITQIQQCKGQDLQILIDTINNKYRRQYKYVISTTLNAQFAHEFYTTEKLHSYKSLHEFLLSNHNQTSEKKLKKHAAKELKDVDIDNFARSIRNLKTRYNNDYKKIRTKWLKPSFYKTNK